MDALRDLLACPACGGVLAADWRCRGCGAPYTAPDGIPDLRLGDDARTDAVRRFYEYAPFPGYRPRDSLASLYARAERSKFARLLDQAIPGDARILEIGCGTGQMSIYLTRADRLVIGAERTRASVVLGVGAAGRDHRRRSLQRIRAHPAQPPASRRPDIRVSLDSVRSGAARTRRRTGAAGGVAPGPISASRRALAHPGRSAELVQRERRPVCSDVSQRTHRRDSGRS